MKQVIEDSAEAADRPPEMIFAGHVHNYQRLTETTDDGSQIPYLVTGAGGYYNLHHLMKVDSEHLVPPVTFPDQQGDPVTPTPLRRQERLGPMLGEGRRGTADSGERAPTQGVDHSGCGAGKQSTGFLIVHNAGMWDERGVSTSTSDEQLERRYDVSASS
jgi:hypothetical protein